MWDRDFEPKHVLNGFLNLEFVHLSCFLMCLNEKMTGWQSGLKNFENWKLNSKCKYLDRIYTLFIVEAMNVSEVRMAQMCFKYFSLLHIVEQNILIEILRQIVLIMNIKVGAMRNWWWRKTSIHFYE